MASPQPDKFTKISNELLEVLPLVKWTVAERAILDVVIRKTYGYNKKVDWIANSQFVLLTGMYRQHTSRTVRELLRKNVLYKSGKKIGIQKDYEQWLVEWRLSYVEVTLSYVHMTNVIPRGTTKEDNIQNTFLAEGEGKLKANQDDMNWKAKRYSEDYEEELQIEPDYKPEKKKKKQGVSDDIQSIFDLFSNPAKVTWRLREIERVAAQALFDTYGLETLKRRIDRIEQLKQTHGDDPYFPLVVTPSQLLDKMDAVERYLKQL